MAKTFGQPLHHSLINIGTIEYPYTITLAVRKRLVYDSYLELPKEKQPPEDIWDNPEEIEEWFDKVFGTGKDYSDSLILNINEIEG